MNITTISPNRAAAGTALALGLCLLLVCRAGAGDAHASAAECFQFSWQRARADWLAATAVGERRSDGWKRSCAAFAREGMRYAQQAIDLAPARPEGYYYYGKNVGCYAGSVGKLRALREGLAGKVRHCLEKVYELDRLYDRAEAILGLGRFWAMLPWPLRNLETSLKYYREYQSTEFFSGNDEAHLYLAEVLLDLREAGYAREARALLERAAGAENTEIADRARELLHDNANLCAPSSANP